AGLPRLRFRGVGSKTSPLKPGRRSLGFVHPKRGKGGTLMRKMVLFASVLGVAIALLAAAPADKSKTYSVTADTIEACSCPLFCTCYFGPSAMEHMCQANNVYKFRPGSHYGDVDLSNQVFWISLDLGGEWHKKPGPGMPTEWAVLTFDKSSSKAQRDAIGAI